MKILILLRKGTCVPVSPPLKKLKKQDWGNRPPKTYESNFNPHVFIQFRKQHSQYKAIWSSIVSSQRYCEVYFISLTATKSLLDLTTGYY